MAELELVYDYKHNDRYRLSFNRLTEQVFDFSLENWYQKGFWSDRYIPFSYIDGGEVAANVSVNKMDLILEGERRKAIQIGTVMTHPDYRGKGLSAKLMNHVLDQYQVEYDLFFLFANPNARNFYPRFGFGVIAESRYTLAPGEGKFDKNRPARKLDPSDPDTLRQIYKFMKARRPASRVFGVENGENLAMFHCLYVFNQCIYYLDEEAVLVICSKKEQTLHIFDLICAAKFDIHAVLNRLADEAVKEVVFHFTPDLLEVQPRSAPLVSEDTLFVRGDLFKQKQHFKYPSTSQA